MNEACSTLEIMMDFTRNHPYYDLTLLVPIVLLTALAPLGLILSSKLLRLSRCRIILKTILKVDSGEKMGFQITVLLAMMIYIEILQEMIPVFDIIDNSPKKWFFTPKFQENLTWDAPICIRIEAFDIKK